jgi:hypothetical protein
MARQMKNAFLLIISLFLMSAHGVDGLPGFVLASNASGSVTRFSVNAPFETFYNDKKYSNGYLELFVLFAADGTINKGGHCGLLHIDAGWPHSSETETGVSGTYLPSNHKVSLFINVDSLEAIQILYNGQTNELENASLINKTNGATLKMAFRDRLDVSLQAKGD